MLWFVRVLKAMPILIAGTKALDVFLNLQHIVTQGIAEVELRQPMPTDPERGNQTAQCEHKSGQSML